MKDWMHYLASSSTPTDSTPSLGSNYGMDGFNFDMDYKGGVMEKARLPSVRGLSGLPDGIVGGDAPGSSVPDALTNETGPDLSELLPGRDDPKTAGLVDLEWLNPTQKQDEDRLPHYAPDRVQQGLIEAWGTERRTDGIRLVPNKDKEIAAYKQELQKGPKSGLPDGQKKEAGHKVKEAVRWAMRASAEGQPLDEIKQAVAKQLGPLAVYASGPLKLVEFEHGLAGKVFIRAAAYPEIHRPKWQQEWKKKLRKLEARYVVVAAGEKTTPWEEIGKIPVQEVPWNTALREYRGALKAAGYVIPKEGEPWQRLKTAFLNGPQFEAPRQEIKPSHTPASSRVSDKSAKQALLASLQEKQQLLSKAAEDLKARKVKAFVQLAKWVKSGQLQRKDADRFVSSEAAPETIIRLAANLIATPRQVSAYAGVGATTYKAQPVEASTKTVWAALREAEKETAEKAAAFEAGQRQKLAKDLGRIVQAGLLTQEETARILQMSQPVAELRRIVAVALQSTHLRPQAVQKATVTREYKGPVVKAAAIKTAKVARILTAEQKMIQTAAVQSGIQAHEFDNLVKWARLQMSEGVAGDMLSEMLKLRFSKPLLKAARKVLAGVREAHEGLAGHLYVDAAAYASSTGTKGCEQGALRHRGNTLRHVLAMDRCTSCVFKNANGACQKYNKALIEKPPVKEAARYQQETIRLANSSDSERTASIFAPGYNPSEFGLESPQAQISLNQIPTPEALGEVLFDDWKV